MILICWFHDSVESLFHPPVLIIQSCGYHSPVPPWLDGTLKKPWFLLKSCQQSQLCIGTVSPKFGPCEITNPSNSSLSIQFIHAAVTIWLYQWFSPQGAAICKKNGCHTIFQFINRYLLILLKRLNLSSNTSFLLTLVLLHCRWKKSRACLILFTLFVFISNFNMFLYPLYKNSFKLVAFPESIYTVCTSYIQYIHISSQGAVSTITLFGCAFT